jgi:restriction system protein
LALKIALPITAVGTAIVGAQGAGIAAFGGAIGAPVALLLFLGTAGATSIIEAFIRDRSIRDPLTKLMLTFVAFETSRRAKKELLAAMRADAMTPMRTVVPDDELQLREFLFQMDPIAFERHVMSFFEASGHPTGLTPRSNDFGVDGYVFHPDGIVVVQCKRYGADNAVGRPAIQQFKGVVEEQKAFRGYVVTTSRFTDEAQESAAKSNRIVLVDGVLLAKWHRDGFVLG